MWMLMRIKYWRGWMIRLGSMSPMLIFALRRRRRYDRDFILAFIMTLYGYTLRYIPLLIMILINKMWSQVSLTPEYIDNISLFIPKTPSKIYKSQYSTRISSITSLLLSDSSIYYNYYIISIKYIVINKAIKQWESIQHSSKPTNTKNILRITQNQK